MDTDREMCLQAGMNDHVSKPIDPDAMFATVMKWTKTGHAHSVAPPVEKAKAASSQEPPDIPEIEGIDIKDGLKRVGGNVQLYRGLLVKFAAKYSDAGLQVTTALQSGDREAAQRIAHTIKGVAGNVGIKRIQLAAEKLEKAIRENDSTYLTMLQDLTEVLHTQIEAIDLALRTSTTTPVESASSKSFDPHAAFHEIARLRSQLEESDGDSEETFRTLQSILSGRVEKAQLDALGANISDFNFTGALSKLDDIVQEHGLNREEVKG
jgi:two-component system sensor histidine kinase/response regulator